MPDYDRAAVRDLLDKSLSKDDLHTIIFDLGEDYDNFGGPDTGKKLRLEKLLLEYQRRDALDTLFSTIAKHRPDIPLPNLPPSLTRASEVSTRYRVAHRHEFRFKKILPVIAAIFLIGLFVTSLGLLDPFVSSMRYSFQDWLINRRTLSESQATAIAKAQLGPEVLKAIPFRNASSDWDYIAVITGTLGDPLVYVRVTEVNKSAFTLHKEATLYALDAFAQMRWLYIENETERNADFMKYLDSIVGVYDIDRDLNKEVFAIQRDGKYSYRNILQLYDVMKQREYSLEAKGNYLSPRLEYYFDPPSIQHTRIGEWLTTKADSLNLFNPDLYPLDNAVMAWLQQNGRANPRGRAVTFEGLQADILKDMTACYIDEKEYTWFSLLHGPLIGYDKHLKSNFVIFVQDNPLDWIMDMVAGEKFLWLGLRVDNGIVGYDKQSGILQVIQTGGLPELDSRSGGVQIIPLELQGGLLHTMDRDGFRVPLAPPPSINPNREFANAKTCQ